MPSSGNVNGGHIPCVEERLPLGYGFERGNVDQSCRQCRLDSSQLQRIISIYKRYIGPTSKIIKLLDGDKVITEHKYIVSQSLFIPVDVNAKLYEIRAEQGGK